MATLTRKLQENASKKFLHEAAATICEIRFLKPLLDMVLACMETLVPVDCIFSPPHNMV